MYVLYFIPILNCINDALKINSIALKVKICIALREKIAATNAKVIRYENDAVKSEKRKLHPSLSAICHLSMGKFRIACRGSFGLNLL